MIGWKINDGIDRQEGRVARDTRWQRSCLIIPCRSLRHVIMSTSSKLFMCPWLRAPSGSWGERLLPHLLFLVALPWCPNDTSALHEYMIWLGKQEQWGKGAGEGDGHKMKDSPKVVDPSCTKNTGKETSETSVSKAPNQQDREIV